MIHGVCVASAWATRVRVGVASLPPHAALATANAPKLKSAIVFLTFTMDKKPCRTYDGARRIRFSDLGRSNMRIFINPKSEICNPLGLAQVPHPLIVACPFKILDGVL